VATPHVFVFDVERKLRFAGRVDDNENPAKAMTHDARDAIEAVLAGKPVSVETTKVFGCSVKWSDKRAWVKEGYEKWRQEPVTLEKRSDEAPVKALAKNEGGKKTAPDQRCGRPGAGRGVIEFPDLGPSPDLPGARLRGGDGERRRRRAAAEGLEFLKAQQASTRQLCLRQGRPLRPHRGGWTRSGRGPCRTTIVVAPEAKVIYRRRGPSTP